MKIQSYLLCLYFGIQCTQTVIAQDRSGNKFGKLTLQDFNLNADKFDSGANVVIISDIGSTQFEGNIKGFFTLVFTRFLRVKIVNKDGLKIGTRLITLRHNDNDYEKVVFLKSSTFNQENGMITETKLDEKSVYIEKYNKDIDFYKFSIPALKEGSIFDLEYTIQSPFEVNLQPWKFQSEYPCLWSEYHVTIPPCFHYEMRLQGEGHFDVDTTKLVPQHFSIHEDQGSSADKVYSITGNSIDRRWIKKNVPALHAQPFTTSLDNYNLMVTFQLNYFQWNDENDKHDYMPTWISSAQTLLKEERFGKVLNYENGWISEELHSIIEATNSDFEKAQRIFRFVRDNFRTTNKEGYSKYGLYTQSSLKEVFRTRHGNVAEINLLMIAMMRKAGIEADPVILSTRDNGIADPSYPMIEEYNYVICVAHIATRDIFLDASEPYNGFGILREECYNGWAHVINSEKPVSVCFTGDSAWETKSTNVIIINDEKGKSSGALTSTVGKGESYDVREEVKGASLKTYEKKIQTYSESEMTIENFGIDSLNNYELPVTIHYDFDLKDFSSANILYFDPMIVDRYGTNPFKSMERLYPVEMPYKIDEIYTITMDIPSGYQVDELPKSARVAYNENEGSFEYLIQKGQDNIQMRVHLKLNKAFFPVDEYSTLRDFFGYVVKKESEQIVFKKK
jgi:Domain of Unknown Function with PDB structure (DUF3858)/Transglutaminase-like superfamily